MALTKEKKEVLVKEYGKNGKDSGSTEVQIALLTERINHITGHLSSFPADHHSRYGLLRMVGRRRSLLDYLGRQDVEKYRSLIKKLNIRK